MGSTTWKKVRRGPAPSTSAASSISIGIDFTNPENMNTAKPAPKPKYTIIKVHGELSLSTSAVRESVAITTWNGTTIEKMQR